MNKKIENKLLTLQNSRNRLIAILDKTEPGKLTKQPGIGKWSIVQIMYHLNRAESLSVIYVSKKRKDINNLKQSGIYEALKIALVRFGFWLPVKYKAPPVLGDMPNTISYSEIRTAWNETRKQLAELIESIPEDMLNKKLFKQPTAGRLNIYQMLDFMQSHFNRHLRQIEALLR